MIFAQVGLSLAKAEASRASVEAHADIAAWRKVVWWVKLLQVAFCFGISEGCLGGPGKVFLRIFLRGS